CRLIRGGRVGKTAPALRSAGGKGHGPARVDVVFDAAARHQAGRHVALNERLNGFRVALVRNDVELDADAIGELQQRDVTDAAGAGYRNGQFARVGLGVGNHAFQVLEWRGRIGDE